MDIATQTLKEHQRLIDLVTELIVTIKKLSQDVQWGDSAWMHDYQYLDFLKVQALSLENVMGNTLQGYYRDSYHLIRMIFEGYFTLALISTCDKYPLRRKIVKGKDEPSLEYTRARCAKEAHDIFGDNLLEIRTEDNGKTMVAVVRGVPVVNDSKEATEVVIPYYYGAWQEFQPVEYHLKKRGVIKKYSTPRFLLGKWAAAPNTQNDLRDKYEALHRYYLTFDRMLENLCLNGILNKSTTTRVLVHYNFLSNFSHCTSESIRVVSERRLHQLSHDGLSNAYDHYLSELALLYTCHLLSMHLQHSIHYFRWRNIKLKNEIKVYRSLCKKVEVNFGYFWFIFNKPHQYDRYVHANRKCNYKKRLFYRPEDIRLGDVRYYENPLDRLKQLHQSQSELTSGNSFTSPFPRRNARF
ncbi:MAG: hypothetical protein PVJ61_00135 [Dehalococcoidia bacterium]